MERIRSEENLTSAVASNGFCINEMLKPVGIIIAALLICSSYVKAQMTIDTVDVTTLSFEDLMNVKIESASKKAENLFDAPLSASVLSKDEIIKAGCTSIMDAFRLMPALLVTEQTNGNFDVHLRGMNDINPTSTIAATTNTTTLVMIDSRPVYSYLHGGTFWETLPIDLNDVERIEVVRGPSSSMYGPNAVSGVINIITRRPKASGVYAVANAQAGTHRTSITNASIGYRFNKKLDILFSGNMQDRHRTQTSYYETFSNAWINEGTSLRNTFGFPEKNLNEKYADPDLAMKKYGLNTFINFAPSQKIHFHLSAGLQDSKVQKPYFENQSTVLTTSASNSNYIDVKGNVGNLSVQLSRLGGTYETQVGAPGQLYDFENLDAVVEYNIVYKSFSLKPGVNFRRTTTDDRKYVEELKDAGTFTGSNFNGNNEITTKAAFLRAEYELLNDKLRLVASTRLDQFNHPDEPYISYQFAATYNLDIRNLVRFAVGRANQSPFINNNYINLIPNRVPLRTSTGQIIPGHFSEVHVFGNTDLKMLTSDMFEIGYRSKPNRNIQFDIELFTAKNRNYTSPVGTATYEEIRGAADTVTVSPVTYQNIFLNARQFGLTLSVNWSVSKIQVKPFVTFQTTSLHDFADFNNTRDAPPSIRNLNDPTNNNIYSGIGSKEKHQGTPTAYGGAFINYELSTKFNINISPYFYSSGTYFYRINAEFRDNERGIEHLSSKLIVNAKVSYSPVQSLSFFVMVKNMLDDRSREFYRSDSMGRFIMGGINFSLK